MGLDPDHGAGATTGFCCCEGDDVLAADDQPRFMPYDMNVIGPIMQSMVNQVMLQQQEQVRAEFKARELEEKEKPPWWLTYEWRAWKCDALQRVAAELSNEDNRVGVEDNLKEAAEAIWDSAGIPSSVRRAQAAGTILQNPGGECTVRNLYVATFDPIGETILDYSGVNNLAIAITGKDPQGREHTAFGRLAQAFYALVKLYPWICAIPFLTRAVRPSIFRRGCGT